MMSQDSGLRASKSHLETVKNSWVSGVIPAAPTSTRWAGARSKESPSPLHKVTLQPEPPPPVPYQHPISRVSKGRPSVHV